MDSILSKDDYQKHVEKREKKKLRKQAKRIVLKELKNLRRSGKKAFLNSKEGEKQIISVLKTFPEYQNIISGAWLDNPENRKQFEEEYRDYVQNAQERIHYTEILNLKNQLISGLDMEEEYRLILPAFENMLFRKADKAVSLRILRCRQHDDPFYDLRGLGKDILIQHARTSLMRLADAYENNTQSKLFRSAFCLFLLQSAKTCSTDIYAEFADYMMKHSRNIKAAIKTAEDIQGTFAKGSVHIPSFRKMIEGKLKSITDFKTLYSDLSSHFTWEYLESLLRANSRYTEAFAELERRQAVSSSIRSLASEATSEDIAGSYPYARSVRRHFILHIGPTNSGKTHAAIQRLSECENGIYLAPLRLLAFEQYERLKPFGCSLITGEEQILCEHAKFQSSTIEMLNMQNEYRCCVIDEAQMLADEKRGCQWSKAILGAFSPEIHVCMAPEAENIVIRLIEMCRDTYEIERHERKTPLICEKRRFRFPDDVQPGDALIVFSRKKVHAAASELKQKGISCSLIYGALPYDVRHREAEKFANGETDVLIATDAIGMGMNLPIRRVVFLETSKYDGSAVRSLMFREIQQIAGRAGRFGKYDKGYVNSERSVFKISSVHLTAQIPSIKTVTLPFPESLLEIEEDAPLSEIMESWNRLKVPDGFRKTNMRSRIILCQYAEQYTDDRHLVYDLSGITVDVDDITRYMIWKDLSKKVIAHSPLDLQTEISSLASETENKSMDELESDYRTLDLIYGFALRYDPGRVSECIQAKNRISAQIIHLLSRQKYLQRKCRYCGKLLPWSFGYPMCEKCYREYYSGYNDGWY